MSDSIHTILRDLIAGQGREVAGDPRRLEALLRDLCPGSARDVHVLVTAARLGIPRELGGSAGVPVELIMPRLARRLIEETAMQEDAAAWAVEAWAAALGMEVKRGGAPAPRVHETAERLRREEQERAIVAERQRAAREAEKQRAEEARQREERTRRVRVEGDRMAVTLAPGVEMELVRVPAGEFLMGSDPKRDAKAYENEQPQRRVYLEEYWIGKYPVTNAQYASYVQATRAQAPEGWNFRNKDTTRYAPAGWKRGRVPGGKEKHPVEWVSWEDARRFCQWVSQATGEGIRLPTEAEWEKAARGTDGRIYPWGNGEPDRERCNYGGNEDDTTPVSQYSPRGDSPYGCADMAGNVWEWAADWYDRDYYKHAPPRDPQGPGPGKYRVSRGGGCRIDAGFVRAAFRGRDHPGRRGYILGFRCARSS